MPNPEEIQLTPQVIAELQKVGVKEGDVLKSPLGGMSFSYSPSGSLVSSGSAVISADQGLKKIDEIKADVNKPIVPPTPAPEGEKTPPPTPEDQLMQRELDATKTQAQKDSDEIKARALQQEADLNSILEPLKARLEQQKQQQISSIQNQYSLLRTKQEEFNARANKLQETISLRFGGRFIPTHAEDLYQEKVSEGLQKIQELNSQENNAISAVRNAFDQKSLTLALDEYDKLTEIRKSRDSELNKIEQTQLKALDEMNKRNKQVSRDSIIVDRINQGETDPFKILQSLNFDKQGNFKGNFTFKEVSDITKEIALNKEKDIGGDVGSWLDALSTGAIPEGTDFKEWLGILHPKDELDMVLKGLNIQKLNRDLTTIQDGFSPKQISSAIQLSNSLKSHPAYSDMSDIATGMQGVLTGLAQENGFGDITAINAFQRMVDPGATVRSEDVVLLQSASAMVQKILSDYPIEKLSKGSKLPDPVREQMKKTAKELYETRARNYNNTTGQQYKKLSEAANLPFELVGQEFPAQASSFGLNVAVDDKEKTVALDKIINENPPSEAPQETGGWFDNFLNIFGL